MFCYGSRKRIESFGSPRRRWIRRLPRAARTGFQSKPWKMWRQPWVARRQWKCAGTVLARWSSPRRITLGCPDPWRRLPQREAIETMKDIQVIDGAENCVYDIFSATDDEFTLIFEAGTDVAFIDEVNGRGDSNLLDAAFDRIWKRRQRKVDAQGIHGILFYELAQKKAYYPTRRDEEAVNPDGTSLR